MCQFPESFLSKTIFPHEMEPNVMYYIGESYFRVDQYGEAYIKKDSPLRLSPVRWDRQHLLTWDSKGYHLSCTVPQNWRVERVYLEGEEYRRYYPVASLLITQTDEVEEV